ncbi:MAG: 30S ribosomal protein S6 [candidate division WOR-3 bacterium]
MNNYEMTIIFDPNFSEKDVARVTQELTGLLTNLGAPVISEIRSERRTFAYPIRKHKEGTYLFIRFQGPPALPEKVRQELMHREEILRLAFFRLPPTPPPTELVNQEKEGGNNG